MKRSLSDSWPRVAIIVLNWNNLEDTQACLRSLQHVDYPNLQIAVVDNGSVDGSPSVISEHSPTVRVLENEENLGYTGGNNVGLKYALKQDADYVLLLNNDTEVAPDFLLRLVDAAEADPLIGIAGPTIYYHSEPDVIWSAGGSIDWRRGEARMVGLNQREIGQFGEVPQERDFVSGCALLTKREMLDRVGLLDERFFAYYEEAEWCTRARSNGFKVIYVPRARVWHKTSTDAQSNSALVHYYMTRNRLLFLRLTGAGIEAWLHTLIGEYVRTLLSWSLRPRWKHSRPQRTVMVRAILDAWQGRWGRQHDSLLEHGDRVACR